VKILLVSEFSMLSTGYSAYYKEIARTLTKAGHEVVELACYGDSNDTSHIRYQKKCPWKVIFNIPNKNDQIAQQMYAERNKRFGDSKYGGWAFDNVCAQEHPDTVIAIRDFWYDKFIVESPASKYMNVVLMATVDSCFTSKTPITCIDDIKNIEDIIVGDRVLTHSGKYKKVVKTFKNLRNNKKIYELRANNFSIPINLTEDHPVWVIQKQRQKNTKRDSNGKRNRIHRSFNNKKSDAKFIKASEIKKGDYLIVPSIKYNKNIESINLLNFIKDKKYYENETQIFSNCASSKLNKIIPINEETLGLFGLYVAEGSSGSAFSVAMNRSKEQEYLELAENTLIKYFNIKSYRVPRDYEDSEEVRAHSRLLENCFNNMFGEGAFNKIIPEFIFNLPKEKLTHFLEKLFIGDGCDTHSPHGKRVISYTTVSKKLAIQIFQLLLKCGCLASLSKKSDNNYYISMNGDYCDKLGSLFKWDSKFKSGELKNNKSWIDEDGDAIILVKHCKETKIDDEYVFNFEVEDDHTYCTGFAVHNCPQRGEWLDVYGRCDYLTTYNEWSQDWLKTQYKCHNLTNFISPSADDIYRPLSKKDCRKFLGIPENVKIGGTVMRNQRRKRYPELFDAVKRVPDMYLYCHTAYPDKGWEIPNLILESGIHDRVFMTFMCNNCNKIEGKLFSTRSPTCSKCGAKMETCSSRKGATNDNLARIYNCFDIYLQPHNSEGFGIPVIEAAKCGVRSITTNYAAQIDVAKRTGAIPVEPLRLERELESNSLRALINTDEWADILNNPKTWVYDPKDIVDIYNKNYSWEMTGSKWLSLIDKIKPKNLWETKPSAKQISSFEELESKNYSNSEFILACIITVANQPNLVGSFMHVELLDCLNSGMYFSPSDDGVFIAMDRKKVYNKFRSIMEYENQWEKARVGIRAGAMSRKN
jgi:intein/homing endonuclease